MTNGFFDASKWTRFIRNTRVRADPINAVFDAIVVAFDLLPPLSTLTSAATSLAEVAGAVAQWAIAAGTADAITAAFPTTVASLTDGLVLGFRATAANATTTPTFKADGTTARTITRSGGTALAVGDIRAAGEYLIRYNLANTRWELLNVGGALLSTRQILTSGSGATYTTPAGVRQLRIRMVGGGGAGSRINGSAAGAVNGGFTSFDNAGTNYKANGGTGATSAAGGGVAGAGGNGGTGGTSPNTTSFPGQAGSPGAALRPGSGGSSIFGGGGPESTAGVANSGGGGGGEQGSDAGAGGGAGEGKEIIINSPAASYTYTIGAGATAVGSAGSGGSGRIVVDETY